MKYKEELIKMFEEVLRETWMDDDDWGVVIKSMDKYFNFKVMERDINTGIKNGYTLEFQLKLCKDLLTSIKRVKTIERGSSDDYPIIDLKK